MRLIDTETHQIHKFTHDNIGIDGQEVSYAILSHIYIRREGQAHRAEYYPKPFRIRFQLSLRFDEMELAGFQLLSVDSPSMPMLPTQMDFYKHTTVSWIGCCDSYSTTPHLFCVFYSKAFGLAIPIALAVEAFRFVGQFELSEGSEPDIRGVVAVLEPLRMANDQDETSFLGSVLRDVKQRPEPDYAAYSVRRVDIEQNCLEIVASSFTSFKLDRVVMSVNVRANTMRRVLVYSWTDLQRQGALTRA